MVVDSSIFVDLIRNYEPAKAAFKTLLIKQSISQITELELIAGTKDKRHMGGVLKLLKTQEVTIIPLNEEISRNASTLFQTYYHSHSLSIEDALIAATALAHNEELVTSNRKHFSFIPNLKIITPY